MRRTRISLETKQYELLPREVQRRGARMAAVVRALITEQLQKGSRSDSNSRRLAAITAIGEGDNQPVAHDHNKFLCSRKRR